MHVRPLIIMTAILALTTAASFWVDRSGAALPARASTADGDKNYIAVRENIFDAAILSRDVYVMVGDRGKIYYSADRGARWIESVNNVREPLFSVSFPDSRNGWASGTSGLVLHTTDGGLSWTKQETGTDKHLFSIHFSDSQNGAAVGDWGAVLVTADGGTTWRDVSMSEDVVLYGVQMRDSQTGWIAGEYGQIWVTRDGAATWQRSLCMGQSFFCLHFDSTNEHLYAAGIDGTIVYSGDMGKNWTTAKTDSKVSIYGISTVGDLGIAAGDNGTVLVSADGGQTWRQADLPAKASRGWLSAAGICRNSAPSGTVAGANGFHLMIEENDLK